jgi:hypothetical protein
MFLAVVNESTLIKPADVQKIVGACAAQLKLHVAPAWDMVPAPIIYYSDKKQIPAGADILTILDSSDQAGFLGYHRVTPDDQQYARVFASPIMNHGGEFLSGAMSVACVMSHEVCEWFVDPLVNLWADGPGGQFAVEICDPVDEVSYELQGVSVSNFVFKRFYDPNAPLTAQFDYMKKVKKPFTPTEGGQLQVLRNGKVEQIGGESAPAWKKAMRQFPAARSARRKSQHHA